MVIMMAYWSMYRGNLKRTGYFQTSNFLDIDEVVAPDSFRHNINLS